jgi:hypothetical protein
MRTLAGRRRIPAKETGDEPISLEENHESSGSRKLADVAIPTQRLSSIDKFAGSDERRHRLEALNAGDCWNWISSQQEGDRWDGCFCVLTIVRRSAMFPNRTSSQHSIFSAASKMFPPHWKSALTEKVNFSSNPYRRTERRTSNCGAGAAPARLPAGCPS